ncbi:MAG: hypothetical protein K9M49_03305 [Candidatus Marinimicrobia bacterium]|nr:hypothetical protein [Candidatus Neomarinimicrobiota bacterium]MCF7850886.1 hypothetical protein [Candidatus Neomarinimicrobiota bacterium]MCF7904161.1 hypothetical protein [Candidatus Neomarinimicrobiota bacterium]
MSEHIRFSLGLIILIVSAITGGILIFSPGSIRLQRPDCGWPGWLFNILNLAFFIILIPLCGVMMIVDTHPASYVCLPTMNSTLVVIGRSLGLLIFLAGSSLLLWSRVSLRRSFRLAGVKPSQSDYLTLHGPYKLMRHPMYLAALLVLLGLALVLISALLAVMFVVMWMLIIKLIPEEENQLDQAYPVAYAEYCKRVPGSLIPK